jgi:F-type H+-transporting ATPase subunit b
MLEILGKIGFDWQVALANFINFVLIVFLLNRFMFKPLGEAMRKRKEKIEGGMEMASRQEDLLLEAQDASGEIVRQARSDAKAIVEEAGNTAKDRENQIVSDAKQTADTLLAEGKKKIEQERGQLTHEVQQKMASLVVAATQKVIGGTPSVDASAAKEAIAHVQADA